MPANARRRAKRLKAGITKRSPQNPPRNPGGTNSFIRTAPLTQPARVWVKDYLQGFTTIGTLDGIPVRVDPNMHSQRFIIGWSK